MSYKVLKPFRDAEDNLHLYRQGDTYPREGYEPSKERIEELASNKNRLGVKLIAKSEPPKKDVDEETNEWPKSIGRGYYELSNGEKVKGKEAALAAQAELDVSN